MNETIEQKAVVEDLVIRQRFPIEDPQEIRAAVRMVPIVGPGTAFVVEPPEPLNPPRVGCE